MKKKSNILVAYSLLMPLNAFVYFLSHQKGERGGEKKTAKKQQKNREKRIQCGSLNT